MEDIENILDPDFFIKDERYNISFIDKSELIIEVLPNRFRFSLRNTITNLIMWLEDYYLDFYDDIKDPSIRLREIFESHQFLKANYWNSINISFDFGVNMVVPIEIFEDQHMSNYIKTYFDTVDVSHFEFYRFINKADGYVFVSGFPKKILEIFLEIYKNKTFEIDSIINGLIIQNVISKSILLHFDNRNLHIIEIDENSNFRNYSICESIKHDFDKNLTSILSDLDLKPQKECFISGEITNFSPYYNKILNQIPNLKYAQIKQGIIFSHYFYELPEHRYVGTYSNIKPLISTK